MSQATETIIKSGANESTPTVESRLSSTEILSMKAIAFLKFHAGQKGKPTSITFVEGASRGNALMNFTQPGCTPFLGAGFVTPSKESMRRLGVSEAVLEEHGTTSPQTAKKLIDAVQNFYPHDIVIANAGNLSQSEKGFTPVHIALTIPKDTLYQQPCPDDTKGNDKLFETTLSLPGDIPESQKAQMIAHCQLSWVMTLLTGEVPNIPFIPDPETNAAVWSPGDNPMQRVVDLAAQKGIKLMTVESCLAGAVGRSIADTAGSQEVYTGTIVAYNYEAKNKLLSINTAAFEAGYVYSPWMAETMAINSHGGRPNLMTTTNTGQLREPDTRHPNPLTVFSATKFNGSTPKSATIFLNDHPSRYHLKQQGTARIAEFMTASLKQIS